MHKREISWKDLTAASQRLSAAAKPRNPFDAQDVYLSRSRYEEIKQVFEDNPDAEAVVIMGDASLFRGMRVIVSEFMPDNIVKVGPDWWRYEDGEWHKLDVPIPEFGPVGPLRYAP